MNHREKKVLHSSQERQQIPSHTHPNGQVISIKQQPNTHRSCLKQRSSIESSEAVESSRLSSTGRVSFAQATSTDGKADLLEKKRQSAVFAKKARELQLAELTYFKDHARDKEPTDE